MFPIVWAGSRSILVEEKGVSRTRESLLAKTGDVGNVWFDAADWHASAGLHMVSVEPPRRPATKDLSVKRNKVTALDIRVRG